MRSAQKMRLHFPSVRCAEVPTSAQLSSESAQCLGTQNSRSVPRSCKFSAQKFAKSLQIFCVFDARRTTAAAGAVAKSLKQVRSYWLRQMCVRWEKNYAFGGALAQNLRRQHSNRLQHFFDFGARRATNASDFTDFALRKALVVGAAFV